MTAETPQKSSRKHKKDKSAVLQGEDTTQDVAVKPKKSKKAKPALVDEAPEADAPGASAEEAATSKEKKHKKRKHVEGDEASAPRDTEEPEKKRKRRKRESDPAAPKVAPRSFPAVAPLEPAEADEETEKSEKSESKKRRAKGESKEAEEQPAKEKKSKKKEKRKREKDATEGQPEGAKSKKKRKHRSTSGYPDPTEDESLSEQAQKALHYAFTQFEEPGSWKFNKARQNWIIRNLWSEEAIPETYVSLVSRYLEGVQGGAREALVKACREAQKPSQTPTDPAPADTTAAEPEASTDSPTKRTVKFTVLEVENNVPAADPVAYETKRQRATALLAVLETSS
ncbi:hypothetical protein C8Q79DRAFT_942247 [Trametes meyenii]|nr:hypothetical protein C8Q79DRAFT_942247 [Trametes meyenii]